MKKIAIVLSTYNNEKIIRKTLLSCLHQNYKNYYMVICDDGSSDSTLAIEREFQQEHSNLFIISLPHGERGIARKTAIEKVKELGCDFLYIMDSDMQLPPDFLEKINAYLDKNSQVGALVIPEIPYSNFNNFFTKVKVFERKIINNGEEDIGKNSIEAARFWKYSEYLKSGEINFSQISFEETQPTIRYLSKGGIIKRASFTGVFHDEGYLTLKNILKKKLYYFSVMDKTLESEENGFLKALSRWYFFRPILYSKKNIKEYFKHPILFLGMIYMYLLLSIIGVYAIIKNSSSK
ncbi:glycosyltransferase family 2 protein [Cetobacterium sp. SF1]|uniref:glycosyltransferase family 2 protein n=1 Tax=Cetobacterium sp. SF1 TaxID=3417654 RepID=UPI003CF11CF7